MSEQNTEKVIYEEIGKVARITLNNGKNNLFSVYVVTRLHELLLKIKNNPEIRALIIQGEGERFSAGFDMKELAVDKLHDVFKIQGREIIQITHSLTIPAVCLIQKFCIGIGALISFACDFRFCLKDVEFCLPESNYDTMFLSHGGMSLISRIVRSHADAKYIMLTGEMIKWQYACEMGLVTKTFDTLEEMREKGLEFATALSKKNPALMSMAKACFEKCAKSSLVDGMAIEDQATFAIIAGGKEKQDLMDKFIKEHQLL